MKQGPLSDNELEWLDDFLLDRVSEDAEADSDEGILGVSELDGFLTALVSGPVFVPPSQWLPVVWGESEPVWEGGEEIEKVLGLIFRHVNGISATLNNAPELFEPLFMERRVDGETFTVVDEWCDGYFRWVGLSVEDWLAGGEEVVELLSPIAAFTGVTNWRGHSIAADVTRMLQQLIPEHARRIHAFWLERRMGVQGRPTRRSHRVGRNDPCPCGSGRKFKKCCLN